MIAPAVSKAEGHGLAGDSLRHRLNNALSRIIACAEGAIDAADDPHQVRALMELIITCAEGATAFCAADAAPGPLDEPHAEVPAPQQPRTP